MLSLPIPVSDSAVVPVIVMSDKGVAVAVRISAGARGRDLVTEALKTLAEPVERRTPWLVRVREGHVAAVPDLDAPLVRTESSGDFWYLSLAESASSPQVTFIVSHW